MPVSRILYPARHWTYRPLILWHGCTAADQAAIVKSGVDPLRGRIDTDFGRGFYTTTIKRQARQWAWARYYDLSYKRPRPANISPVVLRFEVDPHALAALNTLSFVGGSFTDTDFWSLVQHCRQSITTSIRDHKGPPLPPSGGWYDVVTGPVAAFWTQRVAMQDADQVSFHTAKAAALLTGLIRGPDKSKFVFEDVT
jgi:hypothetical protein